VTSQFIALFKFRRKPNAKDFADVKKTVAEAQKEGVKIHFQYWTLGRYDSVWVIEARSEKQAMKFLLGGPSFAVSETLVAVPREQAVELL